MSSRPPTQELTPGQRQQLLADAERNRAQAARLQVEADRLFDNARGGNNKIARANNGEWQRAQALKLIASAEEMEKRANAPSVNKPKPTPKPKPQSSAPAATAHPPRRVPCPQLA